MTVKEDTVSYLTGIRPTQLKPWDIFPEYYIITLKQVGEIVHDELDQWVYAFKHGEVRDDFDAPSMGTLKEKLDVLKMEASERKQYEKYLLGRAHEEGVMTDAREKGYADGHAVGHSEGHAEGRAEGVELGRSERDAEMRERLKARGMESDEVDALLN